MKNILTVDKIEEIEIDLTGICNLKCPLCTRNYDHAKHLLVKNIRSIDEIKNQLDRFKNLQRVFLAGAISEPTLYPQFFEFIEYLNSRNIYFELFTNGSTHNQSWWKQLGELVPTRCMTCFTICGSTQELHSKYRIGSSLQMILDNATAYRKNNKHNDWVQHIRFEYNKDDLSSGNMNKIFNMFSHVMKVDSEGIRRLDNKILEYDKDIMPEIKRDSKIKYIFSKRPKLGSNICIKCKSLEFKKAYIDQFGKIYPCYIFAEFQKEHFTDKIDYSKILNYEYEDCYLCSEFVNKMIDKFNLDFIC